MLNISTGNLTGNFVWQQSRLGTQGWSTGIDGSPDGSQMIVWEDVTPPAIKGPTDPEWTYLIAPGKVPADLIGKGIGGETNGVPGQVYGGYHCAWASDTVAYITIQDQVIVSTNMTGARTFVATGLTGKPVDANAQTSARTWSQKGATDVSNPDVYYIGMGNNGFWYTLNGTLGASSTFTSPSWLPAATHPANIDGRNVIVAVDNGSTMTGGGTSRRSRIAVSPCGQGVWLTTDGMVNGLKISTSSGAGKIEAVSAMEWIGGKLYVVVVDKSSLYYDQATSTATGGAGATSAGYSDNVRVYDPAGGSWSILDTGAGSMTINIPYQCITKDPRYTDGYFIWLVSGGCSHTQDGTTFVHFHGNGQTHANGIKIQMMARTKPRFRPAVAAKYRYEGIGFALSNPKVIGDYLYAPLGLGPIRTSIADFPLLGFGPSDNPTGSKFPLWEEDTAGNEAKVGQCALWVAGEAWLGAQDVAISRFEFGSRGHKATIYNFPTNGALSDALSMARGPVSGFAVTRRHRSGGSAVSGNAYTLDGKSWQLAPEQPPANPGNNPYVPGGIACGAGYSAIDLPGFAPMLPHGTTDIRSEAWEPLNFFIGSTQLDMNWNGVPDETGTYNGLQGATFANIHDLAAYDYDTGKYHVVLLGSGDGTNTTNSWVYDPLGKAGIYECDQASDWPNFRRVYAGHPNHTANFGLFDCKVLSAPGYLIFASNYLLNGADGWASSKIAVFDKSTWTKREITNPANFTSVSLGDPFPGDSTLCLWGLGWSQSGQFGLWFSRDWSATTPTWKGPFSVPAYGFPSYLDAKRAVAAETGDWGKLLTALKTRGHAFGEYRHGGM